MSLELIPMTAAEFVDYLKQIIPDYAEESVKAGYWEPSEALKKAEESTQRLLPDGIDTPNHYLYRVQDGEQRLGTVWLQVTLGSSIKSAYIFDIVIDETFRGQGYGKQTMRLIEEKAREYGATKIGLNVFMHSPVAVDLYQKLGYKTTSMNMFKELE